MAVWLKTHWISRPTVTTWSNGQTGRSNQRWTPVIGEACSASSPGEAGNALGEALGRRGRGRGRTGRPATTKSAAIVSPERRVTPADAPLVVDSTDPDAGRQPDLDPVPASQASSRVP